MIRRRILRASSDERVFERFADLVRPVAWAPSPIGSDLLGLVLAVHRMRTINASCARELALIIVEAFESDNPRVLGGCVPTIQQFGPLMSAPGGEA